MLFHRFRSTLLALTLAGATAAAFAQARIERRPLPPPAPVAPSGVSLWPAAESISPGTHLLVTTNSNMASPYNCALVSFEAEKIVCKSHRGNHITFDRSIVATIMKPHTRWIRKAVIVSLIGSAAIFGIGIGCAASGAGCAVLILDGLYASLGAAVLDYVVYLTDMIAGPETPTPIYIAPPSPAY